jgi:hypothetical protein
VNSDTTIERRTSRTRSLVPEGLLLATPSEGRFSIRGRLFTSISLAVVSLSFLATSASAADPAHVRQTVGPLVFDAPAGAMCNFCLHEEETFTQNITRFLDDEGNLVRVEDEVDLWVLHRNANTGQTLTEKDHYAAHVDLVTGEVRQTGQTWHLRDESGQLTLTGAGRFVIDLVTGEVISETPEAKSDAARTLCPALGGTPAS